jgi:hypothetical protein
MGLDNIPHEYPCVNKKTAVMVTGQIDCKATQEAGGCPWQNAEDRPQNGHVTGIFGTDCWYRGKYGNALIEKYGEYDQTEGYSFYGSDDDGAYKNAAECFRLSSYIGGLIEETDWDMDSEEHDSHCAGLEYAAWWLRWVAMEADGTDCWY